MAGQKTVKTDGKVQAYLQAIEDVSRRKDCEALAALMAEVTGAGPAMWGTSIVGFGEYHYRYASGHEGDSLRIGFSSRVGKISLYLSGLAYDEARPAEILSRLGAYSRGKGCLYIKHLSDVDLGVLGELVALSWKSPGLGEVGTGP